MFDRLRAWINLPLQEEFVEDLLTTVLKDKGAREDLLNLLSFTSDDAADKEGRPGSRAAKSWAMKLWWKVLYKPVIGQFLYDVVDRHNQYWIQREVPLSKEEAIKVREGIR